MKTKILSALAPALALLLLAPAQVPAAPSIESDKAMSRLGETLTVCGTVSQVAKLKKRTVLNLGQAYPNEDMYFLDWDTNLAGFQSRFGNLQSLQGKRVCGTGTLEMYKGHVQMPLSNPRTLNLDE